MRVLAVDPGEKRIGIAISDPTGTIAAPLVVLPHAARELDAAAIANLADEHEAGLILVGQALGEDNDPTPQSRRASRLAQAIRRQTDRPVILWDESGSTQTARSVRIAMGVSRRKRRGHLDDLAAAVFLQDYLDSQPGAGFSETNP